MKVTITAKIGYTVRVIRRFNSDVIVGLALYDGDHLVMDAKYATVDEYIDNRATNESFRLCEIFKTVKGNTFAYWRDDELDEDYITKIGEAK